MGRPGARAQRAPAPTRTQGRPATLASRSLTALCIGLAALLAACDPGTGPIEVHWDRIACERCRMVLSDRHHSAQVRIGQPNGRSRVYAFDDLGCALIWLDSQPGGADPAAEIWVNDWRTGAWIDARSASYVPNQVTPMEYGLGAQPDAAPGTLTFAQARARIDEIERRFNTHEGHLEGTPLHRPPHPAHSGQVEPAQPRGHRFAAAGLRTAPKILKAALQ